MTLFAHPLRPRTRTILWTLLALPPLAAAIAMPLTPEVVWTASDFLFAFLVLGAAGGGIELLMAVSAAPAYRAAAGIGVFGLLALTWVNAAVGIIGPSAEDYNILYLLLPPLVAAGAGLSRMKSGGMARTMAAAVLAMAAIAAALLLFGQETARADDIARGVRLTGVFALPFVASALLFAIAARGRGVSEPASR